MPAALGARRVTTVCAWKDPESGSIWLGSDSQLTSGDFVERTDFPKWKLMPQVGVALGVSGDIAIMDHAAALFGPKGPGPATPSEFAAEIANRLQSMGWKLEADNPGESASLRSSFLCAWGNELFELYPSQHWALPVPAGLFAAIGSGCRLAVGAWEALEDHREPEYRMHEAIAIAIRRDIYSGGEVWVYEWKA